jgi:hypothetical protein
MGSDAAASKCRCVTSSIAATSFGSILGLGDVEGLGLGAVVGAGLAG